MEEWRNRDETRGFQRVRSTLFEVQRRPGGADRRTGIASGVELLLPLLGMGFLVLWWGSACRRLLRIEVWPLVLLSIIVVGLLAALVLSIALRPIDGYLF